MSFNTMNDLSTTSQLVLITGASGFVGSATALLFLQKGHSVRLPMRKQEQVAAWMKGEHAKKYPGKIEAILLEGGIEKEGVFDEMVKGCSAVVHTASPARFDFEDAEADILKPALAGTLSILESCKKASSVKSVVITSSLAAHTTMEDLQNPKEGFELTEKSWNNTTWEEAAKMPLEKGHEVYSASKALAEKAAFKYAEQPGVHFTVSTIAPTVVLGYDPDPSLKTLKDARSSFGILANMLWDKKEFPPSNGNGFRPELYVSITDAALAHYHAALNPSVSSGHRYLLATKRTTLEHVVRVMVECEPELKGHLPPVEGGGEGKLRGEYRFEAERVEKDFGFEYEPFETFVAAYAKQLVQLAKAGGQL
ncbi:hypothetical protein JCM8547_005821 [Rhodosporidiobolus lusitaniae]